MKASGKKRVLVIDDNEGILFVMRQALGMKAYDVCVFETFEGVASVEMRAPDLIYLDISLGAEDGRVISRQLKQHAGTKDIPIVILTAYSDAAEMAQEAGADAYLKKPFELTQLWDMTAKYA